MSHSIKNINKEFNPTITHPLYLIRSNLYKKISLFSPQFQGKMLDFGCGLKPYKELFKVDEYIGVDYKAEGETYEQSMVDVFYDGKTIPFPSNYFDCIFSTEVFEHIFNLQEIMVELNRVLKPGGKILITCPFAIGEHEIPSDFARYTSFAIKHIFNSNNFSVLEFNKTGSYLEATMQLRIIYWNNHILSVFRKIPIIRQILRKSIIASMNIIALINKTIFPKSDELYLNNVILAEKN